MASAPTSDDVELARAAAERPLAATHRSTVRRLSAADWTAGVVEEGGQFHRVLVLPGVGAVRMARTAAVAERLPARMAVVRSLDTTAALPFAVPVPLTEVVGFGDGLAAVVQEYLPGGAHPPHTGDVTVLRGLCETLAGIDLAPLEPHLGPPFAFQGPWTDEKIAAVQAIPGLLVEKHGAGTWSDGSAEGLGAAEGPGAAVSMARWTGTVATLTTTYKDWTEHPVVEPSLVHGDLAGHNMRWQLRAGAPGALAGGQADVEGGDDGWVLTGILDWDLAAVWDPALNPAYLSLWHGEEKLESIARDSEEALRGRVWLGWMALETIYDASLREGGENDEDDARPANWPKLLCKVLPRVERAVAAEAQWRAAQAATVPTTGARMPTDRTPTAHTPTAHAPAVGSEG